MSTGETEATAGGEAEPLRAQPDGRPEPGRSESRGTFALLVDRTFGPYFWGNFASNVGTWFQQITAAIVVFELTRSAFMVGLVGVFQYAPSLLLAPWTGAAADRFDRRRLLLAAHSLAWLASTGLAALTLALGADGLPGPWPVLATALLIGIGNAMSVAAQQALIPALVPPADLDQALALNSVTYNLARAIGPAAGAAVIVTWGAGVAFAVNAVSYLPLLGALLVVRPLFLHRGGRSRGSVWVGIRHLRNDPIVAVLLVGVTALGFGADPVATLTPALAADLPAGAGPLGNPDSLVGLLVSMFGAGAMIATFLVARARTAWGHRNVALIGLSLIGTGMISLSLATNPVWALGSLLVAGSGFLLGVTALTTLVHLRIPEDLRGRIMALWGVAFLGSRPLAAVLDGAVADLASPRVAVAVSASIVLACLAVLARFVPSPHAALTSGGGSRGGGGR